MEPRSLGWRTDLIFARFDGEVTAHADHMVVRTPRDPTFWWGNFLLFGAAPREGDAPTWLARFEAEIAAKQPDSRHITFGVDSEAAFELPAEADAAVELQVVADAGVVETPADYRLFRQRQMRRYEAMERAGMGHWFAVQACHAEGGEQLVADCGLFHEPGQKLGRFQHVVTHPLWRRRGLCSALIHAVCQRGFDRMGLDTLVIVADPDDVAIRLYEALGFERGASIWHLEKAPPHAA